MSVITDIKRLIKSPLLIVPYLGRKRLLNFMTDELYLKLTYRARMGKSLNLNNPELFSEKLQYMKLYNRNPEYTKLVDKLKVREFIRKEIGSSYLVPLLGVWDRFEDINFEKLPNKFVLKTTHGSGGVVICSDKNKFNMERAKSNLNKSLNENYFYVGREWPYKNVQPRIICEEFIETENSNLPDDYKFFCFNGRVDNIMIATDRNVDEGKAKFYFFDPDWNLLRYNETGVNAPKDFSLPRPENLNKMIKVAEKLSENLPFARIDLYNENSKVYFGEVTFFPGGGMDPNLTDDADIIFGEKLKL